MVLGANKWIHPDATLLTSKVVYNVKFVGMTEAKGPRGIDVVNDALQKLKFSRHIKRTEGAKPPKVELSINIHGVKITDNRTKVDLHDIPLHRVSFCADDKQDKRMFSFIAKSDDGKHYCYGLDSQHEANNITLTIGQSFELAYTSFLKTDKGVATSKQVVDLNKRIHVLEKENSDLKQRISELERTSPAKSMEHHKPQSLQSSDQNMTKEKEIIPLISEEIQKSCVAPSMPEDSHEPNAGFLKNTSPLTDPSVQATKPTLVNTSGHMTRQMQKQVYIDQTIASVERAKASLKNLKDFVKQRKLKKRARAIIADDSPTHSYCSETASGSGTPSISGARPKMIQKDSDRQSAVKNTPPPFTLPSSADLNNLGFNSLPARVQPRETREKSAITRANRNSAASLFVGLEEVMSTIEEMMKVEKLNENSTTKIGILQESNIPETNLNDSIPISESEAIYANISHIQPSSPISTDQVALPIAPPPIPPKPLKMQAAVSSDSLNPGNMCNSAYSGSSSDMSSSVDALSNHAYYFNPPPYLGPELISRENEVGQNSNLDQKLVDSETLFNNYVKDNLSETLDRLSGQEGYMELKRKVGKMDQDLYVDSMYDNVHKLMETIRNENFMLKPKPLATSEGNTSIAHHNKPQLKSDHGFLPYNVHKQRELDDQDKALHHLDFPSYNPSNAQSKAPEIPSKDAFDMPLFSPTHSPLVKIASPSQVYPTRGVPRRRSVGLNSPSSNSTDSSKQPQDPFGEITKLNKHLSSPETPGCTNNTDLLNNLLASPDFASLLQQLTSNMASVSFSKPQTITTQSHAAPINTLTCDNQQYNPTSLKKPAKPKRVNRDDDFNRKMKILEEGFSKGLTMQEAELSLDAFDPLKSGH